MGFISNTCDSANETSIGRWCMVNDCPCCCFPLNLCRCDDCSDSDEERRQQAPEAEEAEEEEDEFERMFAGAKGRRRRASMAEVSSLKVQ